MGVDLQVVARCQGDIGEICIKPQLLEAFGGTAIKLAPGYIQLVLSHASDHEDALKYSSSSRVPLAT